MLCHTSSGTFCISEEREETGGILYPPMKPSHTHLATYESQNWGEILATVCHRK